MRTSGRGNLFVVVLSIACFLLGVAGAAFAEPLGTVGEVILVDSNGLFESSNVNLDGLKTRVGDVATTSNVNDDMQSLFDTGYFEKVSSFAEPLSDGLLAIVFEVQSNPIVKKVVFEGVEPLLEVVVRDLTETKAGSVFNRAVLSKDAQRVTEWFRNNGRPYGRMASYRLSEAGVLYLVIDQGTIGEVNVYSESSLTRLEGLSEVLSGFVNQPLTQETVQYMSELLWAEESVASIEDVRLSQVDNGSSVKVDFYVARNFTGRYEVGAGYNTRDGFLFYGSLSKGRLFDTEREIAAKLRLSQKNTLYELSYIDAELCSTCWDRLRLDLYRRQGTFGFQQTQTEVRSGVGVAIDKTLAEPLVATVGFTYNNIQSGSASNRLVELNTGLRHETQNTLLRVAADYTSPSLGSDFEYIKGEFFLGGRHPISAGELQASIRYGLLSGSSVPESVYFRTGGPGSLRGYPFSWAKGERLVAGTIEYVYPVWKSVGVAAFADVASIGAVGGPFDFETSVGLGVRVDTPVGLFKLDYASDENDQMKFVFGLGVEW